MRFRVPIMYNTDVVLKGRRLPSTEAGCEWLDVEVDDTDDFGAPIATQWIDEHGVPMHTRWKDGHHWSPYICHDQDTNVRTFLNAGDMADMLAEGRVFGNPLAVGVDHVLREFGAGTRKTFDKNDFKKVNDTNRPAVAAKAMAKARGCLVVDGIVHVLVTEPVYIISRHDIEKTANGHILRIRVKPVSESGSSNAADTFKADRYEDMAEEAKARFSPELLIDESRRITVFLPGSLGYDDDRNALLATIDTVLSAKRRELHSSTLPAIREWLDLAESREAIKRDWNTDTLAAMETAAEHYASSALEDGYYGEILRSSLARWHVRPIDADHEDGAAPKPF